jgi:glycosyltransferase involved in cell wall biosynthesis
MNVIKSRDTVYLIGPSTETRGGIGYVISDYLKCSLNTEFSLFHIVTHRDGNKVTKLWTYVTALLRFTLVSVLQGRGIAHIHSSSGASFLRKCGIALISRCFRHRVIFHIHSGNFIDYYQTGGRCVRLLIRWVLKAADCVIVLTPFWKREIEALTSGCSRMIVISNGVDTRKYRPAEQNDRKRDGTNLLFLGALISAKGVYDLVKAAGELKRAGLLLHLTIAGDRELAKVRRCSQAEGVDDAMDLPGWVAEEKKLQLLRETDILVLPSYKEGLPLCVLEAMACGLPIICSNIGGLADLVKEGENGFLVEPGDVKRLSSCIRTLVRDQRLREEMGRRNRQKIVVGYGIDCVSAAVASLYREMLSQV